MDEAKATWIIFQSAKLADTACIIRELDWAQGHLQSNPTPGCIFGVSGGNLTALAYALTLCSRLQPHIWKNTDNAISDFRNFLDSAHSRQLRSFKLNFSYGFHSLQPLRKWLCAYLRERSGRDDWLVSELKIPLYLCSLDNDAVFRMYGPPDVTLQCAHGFVRIGPPKDAPIVDALIAGVSTLLSTESVQVNGAWRFDCRPAIVDAGAIVADFQGGQNIPIIRTSPFVHIKQWPLNWFTSSFIMHSQHERNHALLGAHYMDLQQRHKILAEQTADRDLPPRTSQMPCVGHIDLPYIGSTEAITNMRQTMENRNSLIIRFTGTLRGQLGSFTFDKPVNIIYGAGGFSGILAGMVATKAVDEQFARMGGEIRYVYGVSAGVLNAFFHSVQIAAARHPDKYTAAARHALDDLEKLMIHPEPKFFVAVNKNPLRLWKGFGNLRPLENFLLERLSAYTGNTNPADITFDDIALPLTVAASRRDGYPDYMGMTVPPRSFIWQNRRWEVKTAPVVKAIIASWSMNTYIMPTRLNGQEYTDGGGTFYDQALMAACFDDELTNLLNIHLAEPEGHSYNLPEHFTLITSLFDTHNLCFPEERRRMRKTVDLLYEHYALRERVKIAGIGVSDDFRKNWTIEFDKSVDLTQ